MLRFFACGLIALSALGCGRKKADDTRKTSSPAEVVSAAPARATDVTFFVLSDLHFGFGYPDDLHELPPEPTAHPVGLEKTHQRVIAAMNALPGRSYPASMGGRVAPPRGLVLTGDLTEWGRVEEWQRFVAYYGLHGNDGLLRIPVFEGIGNHDRVHGPWVEERVRERHGGRFYAWDWDDLHLVSLGEAPDDEGLAFLRDDLAKLGTRRPYVLFFHFPLAGPWSTGQWFGDGGFRDRLAAIVAEHPPRAIFHGHHHAIGHYVWNGIDVYKPGAVKDSTHDFMVVHVTNAQFRVARFDYDEDKWE